MINSDLYKEYIVPTYNPSLNFIRAKGSHLYTDSGQGFLDITSGISVCNLGHCPDKLNKELALQSQKLWHTSNIYSHNISALLAEKIIQKSFAKGKVFFTNSGTEANEAILKLIRKFGNLDKIKRPEIICFQQSFHGRSYGSLSATGQEKLWQNFKPLLPKIKHIPINDIQAFDDAITPETAGVLMELVLGEGGIVPLDIKFVQHVRKKTKEHHMLLAIDEIQTGMGRTGKFFAFQKYDIQPDVFSIAKALGNGFPMGAMVVRDKYADLLQVGDHGSTFGGGALACAISLKVFEIYEEENILKGVLFKTELFHKHLLKLKKKFSFIKEIRQLGLMIGIELEFEVKSLLKICQKNCLLILSAGEKVLRLLPALNINEEEITLCFERLTKSLEQYKKGK